MARYPDAVWVPLGAQSEPRMRAYDIVCMHTMVGSLLGTERYFKQQGYGGTESHFGVGGSSDRSRDGQVRQWQDTAHQADANLDGNWHVLSIETSDGGDPSRPWSTKQLNAIVNTIAWLCRTHDIPPVLIPDTRPGRRGLAYHRQGVPASRWHQGEPGWLVPGGERWSSSVGKTCPGDVRIEQFIDTVIPHVQAALGDEEDDMPSAAEVAEAVWAAEFGDATRQTADRKSVV